MLVREIKPAGSKLPRGMSSSGNRKLDILKHQLLQDPDWAAVSAARPLEITFAPVEEIERFGKRRKLNDKDHKRLSAAPALGNNLQPSLSNSREPDALWNADLDRIRISINGRPVGMHSSDSQGLITVNTSSQSMLLDHEQNPNFHSSAPAKTPWALSPNRLSLQPNSGQAHPRFERSISPPLRTPAFKDFDSIKRKMTPVLDPYPFADTDMEHRNPVFSERSVTQSPPLPDPTQSMRQHLTIDDQALVEQTMVEERARQPNFGPYRSPLGIPDASPNLRSTDVLPHSTASSWLPQTQRTGASSSPHTSHSHAATFRRPAANMSPHSNLSRNPFLDSTESNHRSPTAKVFGQIVQIRSDGADYE